MQSLWKRASITGLLALALVPAVAKAQSFAYVTNEGDNTVSAYTINATTGALTPIPGSPFPVGPFPADLVVDPSGRFAYVSNYTNFGECTIGPGTVSAFTINATTGALTPIPGSPFPSGSGSFGLTVDPSGRFVYVANYCPDSNDISAYTINATTGALTPIPGSPFPAGAQPTHVAVDPLGRFAYVNNVFSNDISVFSINATTGALTPIPGSPFPAGTYPFNLRIEPTGRFAYVPNNGSDDISVFSINATTGALTPIPGSPFARPAAGGATVDPTGRFVYVASCPSNTISAYTIDATTGALTPISGSPFPAGSCPYDISVDSTDSFVYVANDYSNDVSAYTIDAITGALTPISGAPYPAGSLPASVTTVTQGVAPTITSLTATPNVLWPPNHKMVSVSLNVTAAGNPSPTCQISSVVSSEASTKAGEAEWVITGPLSVNLRAERAGSGPGRVYTVAVTCTNSVNPDATNTVTVSVPHDQRK